MPSLPNNILPPPAGDDVDRLVQRVRLIQMIPSSSTTFSDQNIIDLLDQELKSTVIPLVMDVREEYTVVSRDYVLPAIPAGQTTNVQNYITIPPEASGLRLRDVYYLDSVGNFVNLPRLSPEKIASYTTIPLVATPGVSYSGGYGGFYLQGNQLMIYPYWSATARPVRLTFNRRPAMLESTSKAAQIIAISGNVVSLGSTLTTWFAGSYVDFIQNDTPHDYVTDTSATQALYTSLIPLQNVPVLAASGNTLTFDSSVIQSLQVGQWVADIGYAPFTQFIPPEAVPYLIQLVCCRCLEGLNDREGLQVADAKAKQLAKNLIDLISPRVVGKALKIANPNSLARNNGAFSQRLR